MIAWYRKKIEEKLEHNCDEVLEMLKDVSARYSVKDNAEASAFFAKMAGDYYRYKCEFTVGDK